MALETWLIKVKTVISSTVRTKNKMVIKKSHIGVMAFEIAGIMSKLLHLWQSLSDKNIDSIRHEAITLEGVRKIVSNDDTFLLNLACAEIVENLRLVAKSVSRLGKQCRTMGLRCFDRLFDEFANSGSDPHNWVLSLKEMEAKLKKMDHYVTLTANLHKEIGELSEIEHNLKKLLQCSEHDLLIKEKKISEVQQKLVYKKQEVKNLKESSLWRRSFDMVTLLLARSVFTILARIKLVFEIGQGHSTINDLLPRSLSVSAMVYPSSERSCKHDEKEDHINKFFDLNSKLLKPPPSTLGGVALALHYANLIIVIEKMIKSPQLIGIDARDDLYGMLPSSIRSSLRARLRGVGFSASDPVLAGEWREAMGRILGWLSPLAHNMIKWQSERSFEQQNLMPRTNVLLLQTLYLANQEKTEAAITELLVGLNYIWRFEREMNIKALLECSDFNGKLNLKYSG